MNTHDHLVDEKEQYYPEVIVMFLFLIVFGCVMGVAITLVIQLVAKVIYA